ncbi:MAG: ATP-binding protein [Cyanobacteria bacterium P01_H01_bin.21]
MGNRLPTNLKKLWQTSLRIQIAGSFSLLSLIIVTLVGYFTFIQARETLKQSVIERLTTVAALKEDDLNRWLLDRRDTLLSLNQLTEVNASATALLRHNKETPEHQSASQQLQRLLGEFIHNRSDFREVLVISNGGRVLMSTDPTNVGWYATLNEYSDTTQSFQDNAFIANFYASPITEQPTITFTTPILGEDNQQLGLLAVHLNLDEIDQIIRDSQIFGTSGETYLIADLGSNFFHKNVFVSADRFGSDEFPDSIESDGIVNAMAGQDGFDLYQNYRGTPVIGVYRWLEEHDVALLVEMSERVAFAPAHQLFRSILLVGLLLATILTVCILVLSHQIVAPISKIAQTARSIRKSVKQGDFSDLEAVTVSSNNELGTLAATFNQMTQQLQSSYEELNVKNSDLRSALEDLQRTQMQLIHNEKMAGLGQMIAGIAHEINNPVSFIYGNLDHVDEYAHGLLNLIETYAVEYPHDKPAVATEKEDIELNFIQEDFPKILDSMRMGAERIQEIVKSMRSFSRLDESERKLANLHEGLESTLLILRNRLKTQPNRPEIKIVKEYGKLPLVECYPSQLNQVFLNLISNAIDAFESGPVYGQLENPVIRIVTQYSQAKVTIRIIDNGSGMSENTRQKIFEPFFTTKPVGKGTGLGLSISHSIIVEHHGGELHCLSSLDQGTEFVLVLHSPD